MYRHINWPKFWLASVLSSILIFILDIPFHLHFAGPLMDIEYWRKGEHDMTPYYYIVLFISYILMFAVMNYIQQRLYPDLTVKSALFWGAVAGFMILNPNIQFYVALKFFSTQLIIVQVIEGIILTMLQHTVYALLYRKFVGKLSAS